MAFKKDGSKLIKVLYTCFLVIAMFNTYLYIFVYWNTYEATLFSLQKKIFSLSGIHIIYTDLTYKQTNVIEL